MKIKIIDSLTRKRLLSPAYNFVYNKETGYFVRWGKTFDDDPDFGLPEIVDIEVTTICSGINGVPCKFCYKSNTQQGQNMSFATFKTILDKLPKSITQVAFGADSEGTSNPDLFAMMEYCREIGIVPNITVANITDKTAKRLAELCGAVSVSFYGKDSCYSSIAKLTKHGLEQANIHCLLAEETYDMALELLKDIKTDERLKDARAIVFLSLKQKGRGEAFTPLSKEKFKNIVDASLASEISFGFDSCGCNKFLESVSDHSRIKEFKTMSEPCESLCFSMYCDVNGHFYPCSFTEGIPGWEEGIDLTKIDDFLKDVWFSPRVIETRNKIIATRKKQESCFYFTI